MLRPALCLALAVFAGPARAQHRLPAAGVFFDDFRYRNTEPPLGGIADRPLAENALFGVNPWCLDLGCTRTAVVRGWYWYNYVENYFQAVDPLAGLDAVPGGTGALDFTLRAGRHAFAGVAPRQIASGLAARTGTWAASADFSDLPNGLPPHMVARGTPPGRAAMMQSFWLVSPNSAIRTADLATPSPEQRKTRTETDFEFNNWFFEDGQPLFMATGYYENGDDPDGDGREPNQMDLAAPVAPDGTPGGAPHSCRVERRTGRGARTTVEAPATCAAILAGTDPGAGRDTRTLMAMHLTGDRAHFELRSTWATTSEQGAMSMETDTFTGPIQPSQLQMLMLSFYPADADGTGTITVPTDQRMRVDWAYYTPDAARSLADIAADIALVRRQPRPPARLYTIPDPSPARSLARPYRTRVAEDREPTYEVIVALDPVRIDTVLGPRTARLDEPVEYVGVLARRGGDYRFEWRWAPVAADGRAGPPTAYDGTPGLRWRPAFRFRGTRPPCVRVDLRVTRLEYHSAPAGVSWTSLAGTGRDRTEASVVTCEPGRRRPPR